MGGSTRPYYGEAGDIVQPLSAALGRACRQLIGGNQGHLAYRTEAKYLIDLSDPIAQQDRAAVS